MAYFEMWKQKEHLNDSPSKLGGEGQFLKKKKKKPCYNENFQFIFISLLFLVCLSHLKIYSTYIAKRPSMSAASLASPNSPLAPKNAALMRPQSLEARQEQLIDQLNKCAWRSVEGFEEFPFNT